MKLLQLLASSLYALIVDGLGKGFVSGIADFHYLMARFPMIYGCVTLDSKSIFWVLGRANVGNYLKNKHICYNFVFSNLRKTFTITNSFCDLKIRALTLSLETKIQSPWENQSFRTTWNYTSFSEYCLLPLEFEKK